MGNGADIGEITCVISLWLFSIAGIAGASSANAGSYDISYTVGGETASFVLTTSDTADPSWPGGYDILGISGLLGSAAITGLVATSSPGAITSAPVGTVPIEFNNV